MSWYLSLHLFLILTVSFMVSRPSLAEEKTAKQAKTPEQREEEFQKALAERLKRDQKSMEEFFQSDDFKMLQDRMKRLMESFGAWDDLNIDDFLQQNLPGQGFGNIKNSGVETWWEESAGERTLVIKARKNKSDPFNISVEDHTIKISGTALNEVKDETGRVISKSYSSVNLSQNVPDDVDPGSVRYDQDKKGNILVIFKKLAGAPAMKKKQKKEQDKSFKPLSPGKDDTTI